MAMNIPLPGDFGESFGRGLEHGSSLFARLIQPKLERERAEREWQQHAENHALRQEQEERLRQELALTQALHPYQIQNLLSQIGQHNASAAKSNFDMDPSAQLSMMQSILSGLGGAQQPYTSEGSYNGIGTGETLDNVPHYENMDALRAQLIKNKFGIDLNAETPEQKRLADLRAFEQKENLKREGKAAIDNTLPTRAILTQNQNIVAASNNLLPALKSLKEKGAPNQALKYLTPNDQAKYEAQTNAIADALIGVLALPKTDQSLHMVKSLVQRQKLETEASWKEKIGDVIKDVEERRKAANEILSTKKVEPRERHDNEAPDMGHVNKGIRKGHYLGKDLDIAPEDVEDFVEMGGVLL